MERRLTCYSRDCFILSGTQAFKLLHYLSSLSSMIMLLYIVIGAKHSLNIDTVVQQLPLLLHVSNDSFNNAF